MFMDAIFNYLVDQNFWYIAAFAVFSVVFLCEFWGQYVLVMGVYRIYLRDKAEKTNRLRGIGRVFGSYHLLKGVLMDVFANIFIAIFWFTAWREVWYNPLKWEWPREWLVTQRLKRYLNTKPHNSLQYRRAYWICHGSLDLFDPSGDHCDDVVDK